ncbi:hypothetical protein MtrunA17_Chr8g0386461 [Medicago truncatula]|uniref:Uncharacterized protein n=1 Tax=Medicago truncatula TaxID=3880 RepID=A0A396GWX6_MEDTR|nr:hypothetical protein MtrunA17_Chr8g0386461 [Medicago truncatula]
MFEPKEPYGNWIMSQVYKESSYTSLHFINMADKLQIKEVNFCLFMMTMMHKVCRERGMLHAWTPKQYKLAKLTPTEAGCCQPPSECGYPAVNASYYDLTFHPVSPNHDCKRYKNSQNAIIVTCK